MLAGCAMSAAITRARSSPLSASARLTMRYCTGLLSGTGRLAHELAHGGKRFALAPVHLAEGGIAHAPRRIHEERHRQPARAPGGGGFLPGIEHDRQGELLFLEESGNARRAFAVVHREDLERLSRELRAQAFEGRHFLAARVAPCGPEIHQ